VDPISSQTSAELIAALRGIDISVPGRIQGRTTAHTENWIVARLLATLEDARALAYPISLTHGDRPDFLLQTGETSAGIEATEAISKSYAACCALRDREFPDADIDLGLFRWGATPMTLDEMRAFLSDGEMRSDGWAGDSAEHEWANYMKDVIDIKLTKLSSPQFRKFDQNWLAIYDNLPLPNIHLTRANGILQQHFAGLWSRQPSFDAIFIERGPVIAKFTATGFTNLVLRDLWE